MMELVANLEIVTTITDPNKGQSYPKQTVSKTKQDLPELCNKRGNKLEGLKEKDLIESLTNVHLLRGQMGGI